MSNSTSISFSLRRLLVVMVVYAAGLAWYVHLGRIGLFPVLMTATAVSGLVLIARGADIGAIAIAAASAAAGVYAWHFIWQPPYNALPDPYFDAIGAIVGWLAGCVLVRIAAAARRAVHPAPGPDSRRDTEGAVLRNPPHQSNHKS